MAKPKTKSAPTSKAQPKAAAKAATAAKTAPAAKAATAAKTVPAAKTAPAAKPAKNATTAKTTPVATKPTKLAAKPPTKTKSKTASASYTVEELEDASRAVVCHLTVKGPDGIETYTEDMHTIPVAPPEWAALTPITATVRRYLYLMQKEDLAAGRIVLLQMIDGSGVTRVPPGNGWVRAVIDGTFHLVQSDLLLDREHFVNIIGGHEPPPDEARPPFS